MSILQPPRLDDRDYEDLRRELLARIPVHAPEWTDHNPSDPGVALLELFAWLSHNLLVRMQQVPDHMQREFLRLLQVSPRTATAARTFARFGLPRGTLARALIEHGATTRPTTVAAGKLEFQVDDELEVLPVEALPAIKLPGPSAATLDHGQDLADAIAEHTGADVEVGDLTSYETVWLPAPDGDTLPAPTAIGLAVDDALWIALAAPEGLVRRLPTCADGRPDLDPVRAQLAGAVLSVGVRVDDALCGAGDHVTCPDPGAGGHEYPVTWQLASGRFRGGEPRLDDLLYHRLELIDDDPTRGLARSGVVRLQLPRDADAIGSWDPLALLGDADLRGVGQLPPALDDPELEQRVVTWLRCFRPTAPHPRVRWADVNVVGVTQAITAPPELLGNGTGQPDQVVRLGRTPVLADSVVIQVREASGEWVRWQGVPDLALARPDDPHYTLDAVSGEIRFGDGDHGRAPRLGEAIRALSYRSGGGAAGNVSAGALQRIVQGPSALASLQVTNPLAAVGGRDAETLEEARARIPQVLRHRERAVARDDFRDLALETPGVHVGRVEVLPRHKPHERVDGVPGVVTLIVLPAFDPLHPDEPVPDRDMLRRVCEQLEPRRLVTTELYVTPPEYVPLWVSVAVEPDEGYGLSTVRRWVELAVRQFLAPLPPYGPAGDGWPLGRDVTPPDVEAAVLQVEGVRLVREVAVQGRGDAAPNPAGVALARWQLPVVRKVQISDGDLDPIDTGEGDGDAPALDGIAVPFVRESC